MDYNKINSEIENVDINAIPPEDEPQRQYYFIKLLRRWMEQKVKEEGRELTCCVNTFGCQMNARDSEKPSGASGKLGIVLRSVLNKGLCGGLGFQAVLFCAFSA